MAMQPKNTWGFTAKPDFARICRELEAEGATVGRVTSKGTGPVTLVDVRSPSGAACLRMKAQRAHVRDTNLRWLVLDGDHVEALLDTPAPVKVEAFAAPVASGGASGGAATLYGVFVPFTGMRSQAVRGAYASHSQANDAILAAGRDPKTYRINPVFVPAAPRDPVPTPVPAPKWGLFLHVDQSRSCDYPGDFASPDAAMAVVPSSRKHSYYPKQLVLGA